MRVSKRVESGLTDSVLYNIWEVKKEESLVTVSEEIKRVSSNYRNSRENVENRINGIEINGDVEKESRMFKFVYTRKRRKSNVEDFEDNKRVGIRISRRELWRNVEYSEKSCSLVCLGIEYCSDCVFECLLKSILVYMKVCCLSVVDLGVFLCSDPICAVLAANGIRFLLDSPTDRIGVCKIFGTAQSVPVFSVNFSAVPSCFRAMHFGLHYRLQFLSYLPAVSRLNVDEMSHKNEMSNESEMSGEGDGDTLSETNVISAGNSGMKVVMEPYARVSRLVRRNNPYRNGLASHGIMKRKRSFRRRARISSMVGVLRVNGALVSDLITSRKNGILFSTLVSKNKLNGSGKDGSVPNMKMVYPSAFGVACDVDGAMQDADFSSCYANMLVVEADRCYRVQRVTITLEMSDSGEWVLAVKKDGLTRYTHVAQKQMRTHSFNRITHDIVWTADENWKLEFPNKQDWLVFKELYKDCSVRNAPVLSPKTIHIPGVHEVSGYEDGENAFFSRPEAYISVYSDEVARALGKRTANYDMDCEDEKWLSKFNDDSSIKIEHLSDDNFELMIDTFEKALYCCPDDFTDEETIVNLCLDLGRKEVVVTVYDYWMNKRKQKGLPLLQVFQENQPEETSLIPIPGRRKRRPFRSWFSQFGGGKQPDVLQDMSNGQDALREHIPVLKVEEARNAAMRCLESASLKRCRAQMLMVNADLAAYKAVMATRIAEAAHVADPTLVVAHLLG